MKRPIRILLSLLLSFALLVTPALAEDRDHPFQELRTPISFQNEGEWSERDVQIQSGSNTLRGTLTIPNEAADNIPTAILLHGLNTDRHWCDDIAWCLADHGIASVRFDFNGNGLSGGWQENMTISSEVRDSINGKVFIDLRYLCSIIRLRQRMQLQKPFIAPMQAGSG